MHGTSARRGGEPHNEEITMSKPNTSTRVRNVKPANAAGSNKFTSKQDRLVELLRRPNGATVTELTKATGWQAHSVRGAISGVVKKKLGLKVSTEVVEKRGRIYRIAAA
jgi:hypothetical protein